MKNKSLLFIAMIAHLQMTPGCAETPGLHQVVGRVELSDANDGALVGHFIEFVHVENPSSRGFAVIKEDGSFRLESHYQGETVLGVPPGRYLARIVLSDEGDNDAQKAAASAQINRDLLQFEKANFAIDVPVDGAPVWRIDP